MPSRPGHEPRRNRSRKSPAAAAATANRDSRDTILEVAGSLMAERGFAATSIGAICEATKLAPTTIYWHFGSKDGLLAAVVEQGVERWYSELVDAMSDDHDPSSRGQTHAYDRFAEVMADSYRRSPQALRLMLWLGLDRSHPDPEVREAVQQARRRAVGLIAEHIEALLPIGARGEHRDLYERLARFLLVQLDGIFIAHEIDDDADRLDELFSLARTGIAAAGAELLREAHPRSRKPENHKPENHRPENQRRER